MYFALAIAAHGHRIDLLHRDMGDAIQVHAVGEEFVITETPLWVGDLLGRLALDVVSANLDDLASGAEAPAQLCSQVDCQDARPAQFFYWQCAI